MVVAMKINESPRDTSLTFQKQFVEQRSLTADELADMCSLEGKSLVASELPKLSKEEEGRLLKVAILERNTSLVKKDKTSELKFNFSVTPKAFSVDCSQNKLKTFLDIDLGVSSIFRVISNFESLNKEVIDQAQFFTKTAPLLNPRKNEKGFEDKWVLQVVFNFFVDGSEEPSCSKNFILVFDKPLNPEDRDFMQDAVFSAKCTKAALNAILEAMKQDSYSDEFEMKVMAHRLLCPVACFKDTFFGNSQKIEKVLVINNSLDSDKPLITTASFN